MKGRRCAGEWNELIKCFQTLIENWKSLIDDEKWFYGLKRWKYWLKYEKIENTDRKWFYSKDSWWKHTLVMFFNQNILSRAHTFLSD